MATINQPKHIGQNYRSLSTGFLKSYLIHMRPYLLFISGIAGMAGLAISPGHLSVISYIFCSFAFFCGYGFGQALTDCFQIDTDTISSPYRPLVKGLITVKQTLITSILGLLTIGGILTLHNYHNLLLITASGLGLLSYTYFKKTFWWSGPIWNSWIVMLLPVIGYLCSNPNLGFSAIWVNKPLLILCVLTFFSYFNFVIIGYLKDISADRETGYLTFPVAYGWNNSLLVGIVNAIISSIATYFLITTHILKWPSLLIAVIASVIAFGGIIQGLLIKEKVEKNSAIAIGSTVRSFILWHISVVVAFQPDQLFLLGGIGFYLLFELVMYARPQKEQI
ncbi:UbiA family prenyltransferase [Mucilaginibacter paludis]|uniref:UbiA prenyltransferase n=1 Tax=Mucilaginibacter paludis DSM 18603 TaxID=714943 RepID=H1Y3Y1_9SPHI|nr:UbiA family prenyltransferase [Mucilaginibacter paludis]EHQ30926.1 UbiA prenyltransferase [Mucilaginibacter paludis DSM 18603]